MKRKLVIERARWANPSYDSEEQNHGSSQLLNSVDCMCCLGFAMLACGFTREDIYEKATPEDIPGDPMYELPAAVNADYAKLFFVLTEHEDFEDNSSYFRWTDTELSARAVHINDAAHLDLAQRELQLTELFAKHDVELVFV